MEKIYTKIYFSDWKVKTISIISFFLFILEIIMNIVVPFYIKYVLHHIYSMVNLMHTLIYMMIKTNKRIAINGHCLNNLILIFHDSIWQPFHRRVLSVSR